jgi:hypothetical protein
VGTKPEFKKQGALRSHFSLAFLPPLERIAPLHAQFVENLLVG